MLFMILFLTAFVSLHGQSLPLDFQGKKLADFAWNGTTPLSLPEEFSNVTLSLVQEGKEVLLVKESLKELDQMVVHYTLPSFPDYSKPARLQVKGAVKSIFARPIRADIQWNTNTPALEVIASSPSVAQGGAASLVLRSEPLSNLTFVALIDEWNVPYYPQRFKKDGYYALIFPWYFDQGIEASRIVAMDRAGNMSSLPLSAIMTAQNHKFLEKRIQLRDNYGTEKAKELNLTPQEAKKLETNILAINSALSNASPRIFNRWESTRLSFKDAASRWIKSPSLIFQRHAAPIPSGYRVTATFGDQRRYFFRGEQVRESVHVGKDMALRPNMPVYSILDGKVVYADWNRGNGKTVVIDHGMDIYSFYAHNSDFTVKEGASVKAGQQIAVSGTTGQSTGDHVHLSLIVQGMYIQPKEWLSADHIRRQFIAPLVAAEKAIALAPAGGKAQPQPLLAQNSE